MSQQYIDIEDVIFYPWITTYEEYAQFCLDSYDLNINSIERYIDFEELGEDIARDLGYEPDDYYEFGKEYLEDVGYESILNFSNYIDLDMMGSDFGENGYISDYGYIELT